jgi:uncharacterized HAD superfamily protein
VQTVNQTKIYCFDIDGTLCTNTDGDYKNATPYLDVIAEVNRLYQTGNKIFMMTARGSTTGIDWREVTEGQLRSWEVQYHKLVTNKPTADVYIDDKAINAVAWRKTKFCLSLAECQRET